MATELPLLHPQNFKRSCLIALWFMFLTAPIMGVRVDTLNQNVTWRPLNILYIGVGSFVLSFVWRWLFKLKSDNPWQKSAGRRTLFFSRPLVRLTLGVGLLILCLVFPQFSSAYQVNVMVSALLWVILGLGLNIVVGLSGMLVLGYVTFYAIGAYSYALLNIHLDLSFWQALPLGGFIAALAAIVLALPLLRLRGDYLAIVTLGFGEMVRLVLENYSEVFYGPSGISNIPKPSLYYPTWGENGFAFVQANLADISSLTNYAYYLALGLTIVTIIAVNRLRDSRLGRSWMALREDEVACEAMGVNKVSAKLSAFAMGAMWAGFAGVLFAAKTSFINPSSFTFMESALILSMVVLGGMGSIMGVILGSFVLILLPEYLRAFAEYRMLIFGVSMVLMMVFRPQGLMKSERKRWIFQDEPTGGGDSEDSSIPSSSSVPTVAGRATSQENAHV